MIKKLILVFGIIIILSSAIKVKASSDFYFTNLRIAVEDKTATIIWNTNQLATGIISFGLSNSYGNWIQDTRTDTYHETQLGGLMPESDYHFKIEAHQSDGTVIVSDDYTFTTKKDNDTTPPKIFNVRVNFVTGNTITVNWETDELSDSGVYVGLEENKIKDRKGDGAKVKMHDVVIGGLKEGTRYFIQPASRDQKGNEQRGPAISVTTNLTPDRNAGDLQINSLSPFNKALTDDSNSATIKIVTSRPVKGRIIYGEQTGKLNKSQDLMKPRVTETYIYLRELKADTVYFYKLELTDVLGKNLKTAEYSFRTLPVNVLRSPGKNVTPKVTPPAEPKIYAYGQARLSTIKEAQKIKELKALLIKRLGSSAVKKVNLAATSVYVKAYIYGGYPIEAIAQSIKVKARTIHPVFPWSGWKETDQYKADINKN